MPLKPKKRCKSSWASARTTRGIPTIGMWNVCNVFSSNVGEHEHTEDDVFCNVGEHEDTEDEQKKRI